MKEWDWGKSPLEFLLSQYTQLNEIWMNQNGRYQNNERDAVERRVYENFIY